MRVCAIIPAYNEAEAIGEVIRGAAEHCPEVIVVDDGSSDDTSRTAEKAGATLVRLPKNIGKGAALRAGFEVALHRRTADSPGMGPSVPRYTACRIITSCITRSRR